MAFTPFTESDQPTMTAFNEKLQAVLDTAIKAGIKVEYGTYKGTGTYGKGHKNSLSFTQKPKIVFITAPYDSNNRTGATAVIVCGNEMSTVNDLVGGYYLDVEYAENSISWYCYGGVAYNGTSVSATARGQLNDSFYTYHYAAVLEGSDA